MLAYKISSRSFLLVCAKFQELLVEFVFMFFGKNDAHIIQSFCRIVAAMDEVRAFVDGLLCIELVSEDVFINNSYVVYVWCAFFLFTTYMAGRWVGHNQSERWYSACRRTGAGTPVSAAQLASDKGSLIFGNFVLF